MAAEQAPALELAEPLAPVAALEAEVVEEAMKLIPIRRMGKPEEVAAVVSFLMSEDASYITRQVISVNGGMIG